MKFVRRLAHVVSMIAPVVLLTYATLQPAEAQSKQPDKKAADTASQPKTSEPVSTVTQVFNSPHEPEPKAANYKEKIEKFFYNLETDPVVLVTIAIAFFAAWQVKVYREMRDHTTLIERAYVQPAYPREERGLVFQGFTNGTTGVNVHLRIKNEGRTPARITRAQVFIWLRDIPRVLPNPPIYDKDDPDGLRQPLRAFLVAGAEAFTGDFLLLSANDFAALTGPIPTKTIDVLGYVDYIDKFNTRHRAGVGYTFSYASYQLSLAGVIAGHNLMIAGDLDYNYDRPREQGEGEDW